MSKLKPSHEAFGEKTSHMSAELYDYVLQVGVRESDALRRLREETASLEKAVMQISPDQGAFMAFLLQITGAKRVLEVGVFTGYSSLAMALALPDHGELTALDVSEEWTAIARRHWRQAGVDGRIDLRLASATETLRQLLDEGRAGTYDFAFIDADKTSYPTYYEHALKLLRAGGFLALDNAFHDGRVCDLKRADANADTEAIDRLNRAIRDDPRVDIAMLSIGDGLMLCRKRASTGG